MIYFPRPSWGAAQESFYRGATRIGPTASLVIHHTASTQPSSIDKAPGFVRNLEAGGGSGRWIEYHALVDQYGQVFEGFDVRSQGAHCNTVPPGASKSFNSTSHGLCLIGYYYPPYSMVATTGQLDAAARWVADRVLAGDLTVAALDHATSPSSTGWRGHRETGFATACPGTLLDSGDLARMMTQARAYTTGPAPTPEPEDPPVHLYMLQSRATGAVYVVGAGSAPRHIGGDEHAALVDNDVPLFTVGEGEGSWLAQAAELAYGQTQ